MREWRLKIGDPLCLTLAADLRAGETCYANDQIWRLTIGEGEPPALALHTTLGLRARAFRLFPRFTEGDAAITTRLISPCHHPVYQTSSAWILLHSI
jgi:hypothetical protein